MLRADPSSHRSPSGLSPLVVLLLLVVAAFAALPLVTSQAHADSVIGTTSVPAGVTVAADPNNGMVYVGDSNDSAVTVVDGANGVVVQTIPLSGYIGGVAFDPATNQLFVVNELGSLYVIDTSTNSVLDTIPLAGAPAFAAVDPSTNTVYVMNSPDKVTVVNGATDTVTTTITIGDVYALDWVTVDPTTDTVYAVGVTHYDGGGTLAVIDGTTNTVTNYVEFNSENAYYVDVDSVTDTIYVAGGNGLFYFDGSTDALIGSVSIPAVGVRVDSGTGMVYATDLNYESGNPGHVFIVSGATETLSQTLAVGNGPFDLSIDSNTNFVYVVNEFGHTLSIIDGAASGTSQLGVSSQSTSGGALTGYYTILYGASGSVVSSGYTPTTFTLNDGQSYTVQVDDYGSCHFDHWADTGSTSASRMVDISSNTQLVAIYACGGGTSSVTVSSVDQSSNPVFGYYVVLYDSSGSVAGSGFTTKTFATTSGDGYSIQADGYGSCVFSRWSDGVTSDPRSFTATSGPTSFTAVYDCSGSGATIQVSTIDSAGSAIGGYYISLWQGGTMLQSCFSSCSFAVSSGQTYQVEASSYGSESFNHWLSDGATGAETVTVPATGGTTVSLTAVYSP